MTLAAGAPSPTHAPPPPPGPGVTPPFAAPPTEGRTARMWLSLGVAGLAAVLCCGAGGTALVGLVVTQADALNEQAQTIVGDYFDALSDQNYEDAYKLLCDQRQEDETPAQFTARVSREPRITSYQVGEFKLTSLTVPADVTYATGGSDRLEITLAQDRGTGEFEVCGVAG
ncbi:Rv0361 family membrane protein [Phytohabitans sp. LJ34]|uniref:Rv0361 family membrane protein n=1 Tax=Phytohabitans sp. LJ34 TaxID=3452217 RepID=UPI003F8C6C88